MNNGNKILKTKTKRGTQNPKQMKRSQTKFTKTQRQKQKKKQ